VSSRVERRASRWRVRLRLARAGFRGNSVWWQAARCIRRGSAVALGRLAIRRATMSRAAIICAAMGCSEGAVDDESETRASAAASVCQAFGDVPTNEGPVRGVDAAQSCAFLGIPFAAPPLGARRFLAPVPPPHRKQVLQADQFGAACAQLDADGDLLGDEDCLTLNVWAPGGQGKPVLVFLHGGGNVSGSSRQAAYAGQHLARTEQLVVVSGNYRLGPLGYFEYEAVQTPGHFDANNVALSDQLALLEWVEANIAQFGGDPTNITLLGQSAGGRAVCAMLRLGEDVHVPMHRAIISSASCEFESLGVARQFAADIAAQVQCTDKACLDGVSTGDLLQAKPSPPTMTSSSAHNLASPEPDAWRTLRPVPVWFNSNADEVYTTVPELPNEEAYLRLLSSLVGETDASAVRQLYFADAPSPRKALSDALTDARYSCPARSNVELHTRGAPGAKRFRSLLERPLDEAGQHELGSYHGLDLLYAFGTFTEVGYEPTAADRAFSKTLMGFIGNFARSGDPSSAHATWPSQVAPSSEPTTDANAVVLGDESRVAHDPRGEHCAFWDGRSSN